MARSAIALRAVELPATVMPPAERAVVPVPAPDVPARPIWLFRGLFGLNLSLWVGIVAAIHYML